MTSVLFYATHALNLAGLVFAGLYLLLNTVFRLPDLTSRNPGILRITKSALWMSLLSAFLSCLLADPQFVCDILDRTAKLYAAISVTWLAVLLACGITMLFSFASRTAYKKDHAVVIGKLIQIALRGAVPALLLNWLFS